MMATRKNPVVGSRSPLWFWVVLIFTMCKEYSRIWCQFQEWLGECPAAEVRIKKNMERKTTQSQGADDSIQKIRVKRIVEKRECDGDMHDLHASPLRPGAAHLTDCFLQQNIGESIVLWYFWQHFSADFYSAQPQGWLWRDSNISLLFWSSSKWYKGECTGTPQASLWLAYCSSWSCHNKPLSLFLQLRFISSNWMGRQLYSLQNQPDDIPPLPPDLEEVSQLRTSFSAIFGGLQSMCWSRTIASWWMVELCGFIVMRSHSLP